MHPPRRSRLLTPRTLAGLLLLAFLAACVPEPAAESPMPAPANLVAAGSNGSITLTWTASTGATGYSVKRSTTSGGPYTQRGSTTTATFTDTQVANGTTYYYVVSALDAVGESVDSVQASATPAAPTAPPAVPANPSATAGNARVTLNWTVSDGATSYRVKRSTVPGGPYTQIATPTAPPYVDTAVVNDTRYYYVISAVNSVGESADSVQVSAVPVVQNPPPTTFGTWTNVTPAGVNVSTPLPCGNFGTQSAQADPANPSHVYVMFMCQGVWKSTDYGVTWTGPINIGTNGSTVSDCAGGITVVPATVAGGAPTIFEACIRGSATVGVWKSVDGGVNWSVFPVGPTPGRQDYNPPVVDPYDRTHLLMAGHEMNSVVQSVDGGATWTAVPLAAGMLQNVRSGLLFFINTGSATTTRTTWLWLGEAGGNTGTWRTVDGGQTWTQVDRNEHPIGAAQIYQPDDRGALFMAGVSSTLGAGVLRSVDYGQTWAHVGNNDPEIVVTGTAKNVYAMNGGPVGIGNTVDPQFEVASQPGSGTWAKPGTPPALSQGAAQIAVLNNGTQSILVGAMWNSGLWRYVEP